MSELLSNFCSTNWNKKLQAEERGRRGHFAVSISKEKQEPVGEFREGSLGQAWSRSAQTECL